MGESKRTTHGYYLPLDKRNSVGNLICMVSDLLGVKHYKKISWPMVDEYLDRLEYKRVT